MQQRAIMEYVGSEKGPLLVVLAATHGNEKAGIKALSLVEKMLEVEPITNPEFLFKGKVIGLIGNMGAMDRSVRYIDQDLNRMWCDESIESIKKKRKKELNHEEKEITQLLQNIEEELEAYRPSDLYILDLHTTSSSGGIFSIPNNDPESLRVAKNLYAPVILDMLTGISGTTLHYFNKSHFNSPPVTAVTFEAGQHEDPISVNRCIAAIVNCLRSMGCVRQNDVENIHDNVLIAYSAQLPLLSRFLYKHEIEPNDNFKMKQGYKNFDPVIKGEILAEDKHGLIRCKEDGLILMPLYQDQGEEGFYLIQPTG